MDTISQQINELHKKHNTGMITKTVSSVETNSTASSPKNSPVDMRATNDVTVSNISALYIIITHIYITTQLIL